MPFSHSHFDVLIAELCTIGVNLDSREALEMEHHV